MNGMAHDQYRNQPSGIDSPPDTDASPFSALRHVPPSSDDAFCQATPTATESKSITPLVPPEDLELPPWLQECFSAPGESFMRCVLNLLFEVPVTPRQVQMVYELLLVPDPALDAEDAPLPHPDVMCAAVLDVAEWVRVNPDYPLGVPKIYAPTLLQKLLNTALFVLEGHDDVLRAAANGGSPASPLCVQPLLRALAKDANAKFHAGEPQVVDFAHLGVFNGTSMHEWIELEEVAFTQI